MDLDLETTLSMRPVGFDRLKSRKERAASFKCFLLTMRRIDCQIDWQIRYTHIITHHVLCIILNFCSHIRVVDKSLLWFMSEHSVL